MRNIHRNKLINPSWHESIATQWDEYAPPVRPSPSEINAWKKYMALKSHARVLVLGATPELRDMAHELKAQVSIVDASLTMMQEMSTHMKHTNEEEVWMRANWLTMPFAENYFDFVIGDFVFANISVADKPKFLRKILAVLKSNGALIMRVHLPFPQPVSLSELYERYIYHHSPVGKRALNQFVFGVLKTTYRSNDCTYSAMRARRAIHRFMGTREADERRAFKKLMQLIDKVLLKGDKKWEGLSKEKNEKLFSRYFDIHAVEQGRDHDFTNICPLYVLIKK